MHGSEIDDRHTIDHPTLRDCDDSGSGGGDGGGTCTSVFDPSQNHSNQVPYDIALALEAYVSIWFKDTQPTANEFLSVPGKITHKVLECTELDEILLTCVILYALSYGRYVCTNKTSMTNRLNEI